MIFKRRHRKDDKVIVTKEYENLKETIWNLQAVAYNLQCTADEFSQRVGELKELQKATPDYLRRRV